jgi:iron complex outermembrane receptor protein
MRSGVHSVRVNEGGRGGSSQILRLLEKERRGGRRIGSCLALLLCGASSVFGQDAKSLVEEYSNQITVFGERLPLHERQVLDAPAPVSVVTREDIEASGARTLQEVLERVAGVVLHDQSGNPADATVDLRGFPQGTSAAVFLDGVRLNSLDDNGAPFDSLPLEEVERIEIYRGAAAPLYGGGALAGVINVITRREGGIPRVDLTAVAGSFAEREGRLHAHGTLGPVDLVALGIKRKSDGYRENDGMDLDDAMVRAVWRLKEGHELSALLKYHGGEIRQPGALTPEEMASDRRQSPFNLADGSRGTQRLAALSYSYDGGDPLRVSAQIFARGAARDTLSTGRSGFGFRSAYDESLSGVLAEAHGSRTVGPWTFSYGAGGEFTSGRMGARGFYTDAGGDNPSPASSTGTTVRPWGLFARGGVRRGPWELSAGYRWDSSRYDYRDFFAPANDVERTYRQGAGRLSLILHPTNETAAFVTYAQGYRIPSVIDLFAYPGFYSNPDLLPSRSGDWEAGWRVVRKGLHFQVTAFDMRVHDEVVFVLRDPVYFIGQNQNAGLSRRRGIEVEGSWDLGKGFSLTGSVATMDAVITGGPYAGVRVPMVPSETASASLRWSNPSWLAEISGNWVGEQPLDSDLAGAGPELPGYFRLDGNIRYVRGALTMEGAVTNLLGRMYASRGITNGFQDYYTPARPRAVRVTLTWSF